MPEDLPQLPADDSNAETRRASPADMDMTQRSSSVPDTRSLREAPPTQASAPATKRPTPTRAIAAVPPLPLPPALPSGAPLPSAPPGVPAGAGHVAAPKRHRARERRDSGLYLPVWSLALMLLCVAGAAFAIIALVVNLGAQNAPAAAPRIVVTPAAQLPGADTPVSVLVSPTLPPQFDAGIYTAVPSLVLAGPTLAPVLFTATPETIAIGRQVIVRAPESGLNVRAEPGIGATRLFIALDGAIFNVIDGPRQADSLTWWLLQSPTDPTQRGWGAGTYLEVLTPDS